MGAGRASSHPLHQMQLASMPTAAPRCAPTHCTHTRTHTHPPLTFNKRASQAYTGNCLASEKDGGTRLVSAIESEREREREREKEREREREKRKRK